MYFVVAFDGEEKVNLVPIKWINKERNKCKWPITASEKEVVGLIKNRVDPEKNWEDFSIRVLSKKAISK